MYKSKWCSVRQHDLYLFAIVARSLTTLESSFNKMPGSAVFLRYVKSSHQNDPGRTLLELLVVFAFWTLLQSRTRADRTGKHFIQFNDKVREQLFILSKAKCD
jgi:serine palmitoyltransferase